MDVQGWPLKRNVTAVDSEVDSIYEAGKSRREIIFLDFGLISLPSIILFSFATNICGFTFNSSEWCFLICNGIL